MKIIATSRSEQNRALCDPWTVVHFATGLALGLVSAPRMAVVAAAVGWEAVEQWVERQELGQGVFNVTRPESLPNAVADVLVFAAGHSLGRQWHRR